MKSIKYTYRTIVVIILISVTAISVSAQTDSLIFRNGNFIVGEVKTLNKNVVTVKTPYSDKDFNIKWNRIKEIYTDTYFLISLTDGHRYNGTLQSREPGRVTIKTDEGTEVDVNIIDIVFLDDLGRGFWSQLYFSIDVGFDLTRANNFRQFTTNARIGYNAKRWNLDLRGSNLYSRQDSAQNIRRIEYGIKYTYFLPNDWYSLVSSDFLSTTEQKLDLRSTGKIGMGKYVTNTNKSYWGFSAGVNFNNENFTDPEIQDRQSWEGFIGSELNMFNTGDLDLLTKIIAYPSFTESGRWRVDYSIDTKYEMWFDDDFYIKLSFSLNYDNQAVEGAAATDYVFSTGFGWEW